MSKASFTLIHTNDFHNKLTRAKASAIEALKKNAGESTLLLDAGDAISAGNVTYHRSEPVYDLMEMAGYDAMTMGNREFHFSRVGLNAKVRQPSFPILCANLTSVSGDEPPVKKWVNFNLPNTKVTVFGLTVPMITERMKVRVASPFRFTAPQKTAIELTEQIKRIENPDLVVLLSHCGLRVDKEIAEHVPGINIIVGGHTHSVLSEGERVGKSFVVQAGSFARYAGVVNCSHLDGKYTFKARLVEL